MRISLAIVLLIFSACPGTVTGLPPDAGGQLVADGGASCRDDSGCDAGLSCHLPTATCQPLGCLASGCAGGERCDLTSRVCVVSARGPHRLYRAQTIAGHATTSSFSPRDAVGRGAFGEFALLVASRNGRYLYMVDSAVVLRVEVATGWVETLSGNGWPGEVDGPGAVAQFETDFYQNGGLGLSPDQRHFVFTSPFAIRKVDVETGEATTIPNPGPGKPRALAVGRQTGNLYVLDFAPTRMDVVFPDGGAATRMVQSGGSSIGFMVVDESRGLAYGLDRNRQSGALYRWSLDGGAIEWLNPLGHRRARPDPVPLGWPGGEPRHGQPRGHDHRRRRVRLHRRR